MKQNITLSVDSDLYNQYKQYCNKKGFVVSRQIEILIKNQMGGVLHD